MGAFRVYYYWAFLWTQKSFCLVIKNLGGGTQIKKPINASSTRPPCYMVFQETTDYLTAGKWLNENFLGYPVFKLSRSIIFHEEPKIFVELRTVK